MSTYEQMALPGAGIALAEKVQIAIANLREWEPAEGYYLCFSGGKDSCVLRALADEAGVQYDAHYAVTTIDPPELVRFIRKQHPDTTWERPQRPFFAEVPRRGMPTRRGRWCCSEYKERGGEGRWRLLGVRAAESPRRKKQWSQVSVWKNARNLLPILYWSDEDVWAFIRDRELPYCSLYDEGWTRLGCVGCPIANEEHRRREFKRWPRFERLWKRAAFQVWAAKRNNGGMMAKFHSADEFWEWWVRGYGMPEAACDMGLW